MPASQEPAPSCAATQSGQLQAPCLTENQNRTRSRLTLPYTSLFPRLVLSEILFMSSLRALTLVIEIPKLGSDGRRGKISSAVLQCGYCNTYASYQLVCGRCLFKF